MRHALLALLLLCGTARADTDQLVRAAAEGAVVLATELPLKSALAPSTCRWCEPDTLDEAARALRWSHQSLADGLSYGALGADGALVVGTLLLSGRHLGDVGPVLESVTTTALLAQVVKFTVGRERPFVHHATGRAHESDDDLSFFSGHTSIAFALAASAGIVAHQRHYGAEPLIWAGGMLLAAATGYLRVAADKHYLTDVLVGAGVGTAVGLVVPQLSAAPSGGGVSLLSGTW